MSDFPTVSVRPGPGLRSPSLHAIGGTAPNLPGIGRCHRSPVPPLRDHTSPADTAAAPGAYAPPRHLPTPPPPPHARRGKPPGPARRGPGHLLSAATVPASSNRQSWRLRASSRALGPGSCFQSSRSPLLRAMAAAGLREGGAESAGEGGTRPPARVAKEPPSPQAHGARRSEGSQQPGRRATRRELLRARGPRSWQPASPRPVGRTPGGAGREDGRGPFPGAGFPVPARGGPAVTGAESSRRPLSPVPRGFSTQLPPPPPPRGVPRCGQRRRAGATFPFPLRLSLPTHSPL